MDIKKIICTALAVMTAAAAFTACGGDEGSGEDQGKPAVEAQAETSASVGEIADRIKSEVAFEDDLIEFDSGKITKILGVAEDSYTSAKVYESSTGATPEEIACFECIDGDVANAVKLALESRLTAQTNTFTDYKPEQQPKLENAVLKVSGNRVFLVVSGDKAKVEEIIG